VTDMSDSLPLDDPSGLAGRLGPATDRLVVLDFDGVLSPIVDHYDQAAPAAGAVAALTALAEVTTVAVVSGRTVADIRRRLGELAVTVAGGHGAELVLADGTDDPLVDPATLAEALDRAQADVDALVGDEPGWFIERKGTSLAVHHRLAPTESVDTHLPRVRAILEHHTASPPGFAVLDGKAVLELRPADVDKGRALDRIAADSGALRPLMLGDDVTDEDAFRVARARGGDAVLVADEPRPTAATHRLSDPDAVVRFLEALAARGG
jgi:trehalose 6-phosphate phosphatase